MFAIAAGFWSSWSIYGQKDTISASWELCCFQLFNALQCTHCTFIWSYTYIFRWWLAEFKRRQLSKSVICTCYHSNRLTDPLLRGVGPMGTCSVRQLTSTGTIWLSRMFWKAFKRRPRNVYGKLMDTCVPPHSRCTSTTVWEFQSPLTSSLVCSISIGMKCECVEATQCGRACVLFFRTISEYILPWRPIARLSEIVQPVQPAMPFFDTLYIEREIQFCVCMVAELYLSCDNRFV